MRAQPTDLVALRKAAGALLIDGFFRGGSKLAQLHPRARPEAHGVRVERDVAYAATGAHHHLLDVYSPAPDHPARARGPLPVVLYVHGGGFRILSKDSHWVMGLSFARRGYLVFVVNYRLAPAHPFPAALEDCADAYAWVVENAARWGGDLDRLVLAGESAGANLVSSLAIAATFERPEPYARAVFATGRVPRAVAAACGILQVSDTARLGRRRALSQFLSDRLHEVERAYLETSSSPDRTLADPLLVLEGDEAPARPLPPMFLPCGTKDPLLDDTRRMGAALARRGVPGEVRIYPGEVHAFHAFVWRPAAKRCWRDTFAFLDAHVGPPV